MPLKLDVRQAFSARSDRVKSCDVHPTEPWLLCSLYTGHVMIWDYKSETLLKTFEVSQLPVRTAKFIPRKQWFVCGSDDMRIRVYNYNTQEKIKTFPAHTDYIRCLAVHPTLPYLISGSDDMSIRLWNWDQDWKEQQTFLAHSHYVMALQFNPKDPSTFASASLDHTIRVWGVTSPVPHFSLEGHERGVNCLAYFPGGDRPFLVSGADDFLVKIWDYQTKACVATLEGHTNNLSGVCFHPTLPVIISGSEDQTVRIWHSTTYRLEEVLRYKMERCWSVSMIAPGSSGGGSDVSGGGGAGGAGGATAASNAIALGYDDGVVMITLGQERPVASMDKAGNVVWCKNTEVYAANVRVAARQSPADGDTLDLNAKELGATEVYAQSLSHAPHGRTVCVCGDGEFIIYSARALKNKSFGSALEQVWGPDKLFATRESATSVKVFDDASEVRAHKLSFGARAMFGGRLLGVVGAEFIDFYAWDTLRVVQRIEVVPDAVYWSETGETVVLALEDSFYVLSYNAELVDKVFRAGVKTSESGIERAFSVDQEVAEVVSTGTFAGDCFIYTNSVGRLNYYLGGEVVTLAHLDRPAYLLGYLGREDRVFLMDKQHDVLSYELRYAVLAYQAAVVRDDLDAAADLLGKIPHEHHTKLARFLDSKGHKELALDVTRDTEHKFELALQLADLQRAHRVLLEAPTEQKWKQLGDMALAEFDLRLAEECAARAKDVGCLLLLAVAKGDAALLATMAALAREQGRLNLAFIGLFLLHRVDDCVQLLLDADRIAEAAFFARTYCPSQIGAVMAQWRESLGTISARAAEALADPKEYAELFPTLAKGLEVERWIRQAHLAARPASAYAGIEGESRGMNLLEMLEKGTLPDVESIPRLAGAGSSSRRSEPAAAAAAAGAAQAGDDLEEDAELEEAAQASSPEVDDDDDDVVEGEELVLDDGDVDDVDDDDLLGDEDLDDLDDAGDIDEQSLLDEVDDLLNE